MKKFIATLLMGAFLFASMAVTVGCGDEKDKDKKKEEKKVEKKEEKKEK